MKKHPFLLTDFLMTVKLPVQEKREIERWLIYASKTFQSVMSNDDLIHPSWIKHCPTWKVSLLICGENRIKSLNLVHRKKHKVTDVLSFPNYEGLRKKKNPRELVSDEMFLGDLAICYPVAKRQAKKFRVSFMDEFIHLYFHGLFHLLGYDHEISEKEERIMQKWEKLSLDKFSIIKKGSR